MRPRTRRGESFNVKKPVRNRGDQEKRENRPDYENQTYGQTNRQASERAPPHHNFREGKLAPAKSSPSLTQSTPNNPSGSYGNSISSAKSSPNLNNDVKTEKSLSQSSPKRSEYYNNNYERYSIDSRSSALNTSWNLGSGDFKRTYLNQPSQKNMYETTDSYDNEGKNSQSKNTRRSLPPYMLQKYQADYENISDYGTTPLRSEKISEIDDLDSDGDDTCTQGLSSQTKQSDPIASSQSPPIPPVRDPSSLRYVKVNQSHEKYPSWPVTKPNSGSEQSQPINTRAQSWTDHTNTNKEFPGKQRLAYTPGLRPLPERNSPNSERKGEDGKIRVGSDPGLKSEFVYDKYGRVRQRNFDNVDQNQIKKFYDSKPGYPPPKLDSDGHNLGDENYNVPSPPERDVPSLEEREINAKNSLMEKPIVRPTSFTNQIGERSQSKLNYSVQSSTSPMHSPLEAKGGPPSSRSVSNSNLREKTMVDSCTSPQHSPKDPKSPANTGSSAREYQQGPSSQIKSSSKAYIVKQTPYYNTSTQTDRSPTSYNMQVTIPKSVNSAKTAAVNDFGSQTSPTTSDAIAFGDKVIQRQDKQSYSPNDRRSNYADINSVASRSDSEKPKDNGSRNYADYSPIRSNYADIGDFKSIHEKYASDEGPSEPKAQDHIPHYSEYTANQAPILRKLSEEFYKGRMASSYDKRHHTPQESSNRVDPVQPGMKEAESYSSVVIHSSESAGPFGRDDFGSHSSLSDSRHDLSSVISESASNRSSIAKGRRSLDPSMLSQRSRPLHELRYSSSSSVNHSRVNSSPNTDNKSSGPRRPHRSSDSSTPSQPKSSPDSRSSGSTHYSSSDTSRLSGTGGHDIRLESNDSVFNESKSPSATNQGVNKEDTKDKNVDVNLGRKPSMKKAYGIYDETERVLRGAAATLKAVNEAQSLRKAGENYVPMSRLSRGSADSKTLDQIQEENDVFQDNEVQRSRSSSGREDQRAETSAGTKRELFSNDHTSQRPVAAMRRSVSEHISVTSINQSPAISSPDLLQAQTDSAYTRFKTGDMMKRNSESDLKKIQQQAVLNFMEIKTGKRNSSSGSQEGSQGNRGSSGDIKQLPMSPTQSVQDLISKTSENLANRTQRADSFRRSGSSSSSRNSQDYMDMNKPRRETEWSRLRSQASSYGNDAEGKSNRSSMCSENTYEDISVFSPSHTTRHERHKDEIEKNMPDLVQDQTIPISSGMETNLVSSPTYQNLFTARRRPPPPPPLLSPDEKPPALPPRNYRKQPRLNVNNMQGTKKPAAEDQNLQDENVAIDNSKIDFKSLMTQWESSPREDSYAADLRKQARRFSEQQQPLNSTTMAIMHSKTKINFSQSYKREPALAHQATPPHSSDQSFEDQNRVVSPICEQPTVMEEGNKENKAPSTPVKQAFEDEEMKTPPRVERSISDLPLPSPPVNYGESLEGNNSYLPPPPQNVLVIENADEADTFADDSYGAYKNKKSRAPGNYQRSVSGSAVVRIENQEYPEDGLGYTEKKKLGQNSWNSESSLNGAVSQPKRPRDFPNDPPRNVPSFKVESSVRDVIKGTVQPLVAPVHRFPGALPNTISTKSSNYSAQNTHSVPNSNTSAQRFDSLPQNPDNSKSGHDKEAVRNRVYNYESPTKSQTDANRSVTAWLTKNESIANSPVNLGLQPRNIHENLNIQRSKTFNQPPSPVRNIPSQEEIKKRSTFNSPTPYGARPYQTSYSPLHTDKLPQKPTQSITHNRPDDGNKISMEAENIQQARDNRGSSQNIGSTKVSENVTNNNISNYSDRVTQYKGEVSRNSATETSLRLTSSIPSSRSSGEISRDGSGDNFSVKSSVKSDISSQNKTKGVNTSDINKSQQDGNRSINSPTQSNSQSFVVSSNSAMRSSPHSNTSLSSPTNNNSPKTVQSNDSSLKKTTSGSVLPPGTICHGRQRSQEELDCDKQAKELAKELEEQDKKLSDVLIQDSNTKRMQYMDGLFIENVQPRKLSSDENVPKSTKDESSPNKNQTNLDNSSSLPALYFISPPKAVMEMQIRNDEEMTKDMTKDIINSSSGLVKQKEELMEKLFKKLDILRKEKEMLLQEITENDQLGEKVVEIVTERCPHQSEQEKFKYFIEDLEKIVRLLLNLSGQLARAENAVQSLASSTNPKVKKLTIDKCERLHNKHEEAKLLKEDIDKRCVLVSAMLEARLSIEEMEDYNYYIKMKSKLTIDCQELEDRIKLGEEQIQELKKSIPESKS
ncbi:uncharacterized protein LOC126831141 isoform X3 [Patella vulgata]|nr:uncharacterized protein LOC126831141 isoform X3 [Patella vulgata]